MKKYFFVAFLSFCSKGLLAQEISKPKENKYLQYNYGIKLYNESSYTESFARGYSPSSQSLIQQRKNSSDFLRPTFAVQKRTKKGNFHEVELNRFSINKDFLESRQYSPNGQYIVVNRARVTHTNISLKYEYILQFCKNKNSRLVPSLGFAINPYHTKEKYSPLISNEIPQSQSESGFRTFVVPRLSYYFNKRFYLDLNVPLCLTNFSFQHQNIQNPALPIYTRDYGTLNFEVFPKLLSARIGIGMKI